MNRTLQFMNLAGVLLLVVICAAQWQRDRKLNLDLIQHEKLRLAQEQKVAEQERNIRGLTADLESFKQQFTRTHAELAETRNQLQEAERLSRHVTSERDQLQSSLTNWSRAVEERDSRIKEANARIGEMGAQLNEAIQKFNQLATNHNDVVARYNDLAKAQKPQN
jgi:chromosome segregation ATPase